MSAETFATVLGAFATLAGLLAHGVVTLRAGAQRETRLEASIDAVRVSTATNRVELERQISELRESAGDVHDRHERRLDSHAGEIRKHGIAIAELKTAANGRGGR